MSISPNTVKTHMRRVLYKFHVGSKSELQLLLANWDFTGCWPSGGAHEDVGNVSFAGFARPSAGAR